jgi:hypothetical protein
VCRTQEDPPFPGLGTLRRLITTAHRYRTRSGR